MSMCLSECAYIHHSHSGSEPALATGVAHDAPLLHSRRWTGRLKVVQKGKEGAIMLTGKDDVKLFAVCRIAEGAVDKVRVLVIMPMRELRLSLTRLGMPVGHRVAGTGQQQVLCAQDHFPRWAARLHWARIQRPQPLVRLQRRVARV